MLPIFQSFIRQVRAKLIRGQQGNTASPSYGVLCSEFNLVLLTRMRIQSCFSDRRALGNSWKGFKIVHNNIEGHSSMVA